MTELPLKFHCPPGRSCAVGHGDSPRASHCVVFDQKPATWFLTRVSTIGSLGLKKAGVIAIGLKVAKHRFATEMVSTLTGFPGNGRVVDLLPQRDPKSARRRIGNVFTLRTPTSWSKKLILPKDASIRATRSNGAVVQHYFNALTR